MKKKAERGLVLGFVGLVILTLSWDLLVRAVDNTPDEGLCRLVSYNLSLTKESSEREKLTKELKELNCI